MTTATKTAADHFRHLHFGGNWTITHYKDLLSDVSYEMALKKVGDLNNIITLTVHVYYFIPVQLRVFKEGILEGKDELSFDHSFIRSEEDWQAFLQKFWSDAEELAQLIEDFPEEDFLGDFVVPKYGTYARNIHGMIEHAHYHMGQIALIKKMILSDNEL